jgi:hypothetical protein
MGGRTRLGLVVPYFDAARLRISRSEDAAEGLKASLERRPPVFAAADTLALHAARRR